MSYAGRKSWGNCPGKMSAVGIIMCMGEFNVWVPNHSAVQIEFIIQRRVIQYSGAAKLTNCALYDKSTKFGTDVH